MLELRRPSSRSGRPLLPTESSKSASARMAGAPRGRRREMLVVFALCSLMLLSLTRMTWATASGSPSLDTGTGTASTRRGLLDGSLPRQTGRTAGISHGATAAAVAPSVAAAGPDGDRVSGSADHVGKDDSCHQLAGTELPGQVVRWGAGHTTDSAGDVFPSGCSPLPPPLPITCPPICVPLGLPASAGACCVACCNATGCNTWVWCAQPRECGARHRECWLKTRHDPWEDVDVMVRGHGTAWGAGVEEGGKGRRVGPQRGGG